MVYLGAERVFAILQRCCGLDGSQVKWGGRLSIFDGRGRRLSLFCHHRCRISEEVKEGVTIRYNRLSIHVPWMLRA